MQPRWQHERRPPGVISTYPAAIANRWRGLRFECAEKGQQHDSELGEWYRGRDRRQGLRFQHTALHDPRGVGRPFWEAFPTPGERLVSAPAWIETTSTAADFRNEPETGVRTGMLLEHDTRRWTPGLVVARFVVAPTGLLPVVLPMRVLIDVEGYDGGRIAFADFLRQREGLLTAREATDGQLLEMYENVSLADPRTFVRCMPGPGAVNIRPSVDRYDAVAESGYEGLRAGLASTVVELDDLAFDPGDDTGAIVRRRWADYAVARANFLALSAMRLAGLQSRLLH